MSEDAARMFRRSVTALSVAVLGWLALSRFVPVEIRLVHTVPFVALFAVALALATHGRPRWGAAVLLGVGLPILGVQAIETGGPGSLLVTYFPLGVMMTWSWLGRRAGIAAMVAMVGALVVSYGSTPPREPDEAIIAAHLSAMVVSSAFVWSATRDLRLACETAWRRVAEADLAASQAKEANEARDRFLAAVSHELRTPLDTVLGYAEMVREEEEDSDRIGDLDRIHAAGRQLLSLVDDLLDIARTPTSHDPDDRFETFAIDPLLDEVVQTTAPMASAGRNRVTVRRVGALPTMRSDRRRIRQILLNLVSNATKYTAGGEITLEVEVDGDQIRWAVRDTGVGIPEGKLHQLFQPFVQLHEGPERRPGVGLGLALSQRLAERLGGRISAESEPGRGSVFTLRLPVWIGRGSGPTVDANP